jgi:hypothetical protein
VITAASVRDRDAARPLLWNLLTSDVRPGLHLTQPPDNHDHGQQAINS